jgi:hypothetical protein
MRSTAGLTVVELLGVVAMIGILVGVATLWLGPMDDPLDSGAKLLEGFFRQARAKALATTTAHRVVPVTDEHLAVEFANSCSETTWTADPRLELDLPEGVTLTDTSWSVCFTSRGISEAATVVDLWHSEAGTRQVEVLVGGLSRVRE